MVLTHKDIYRSGFDEERVREEKYIWMFVRKNGTRKELDILVKLCTGIMKDFKVAGRVGNLVLMSNKYMTEQREVELNMYAMDRYKGAIEEIVAELEDKEGFMAKLLIEAGPAMIMTNIKGTMGMKQLISTAKKIYEDEEKTFDEEAFTELIEKLRQMDEDGVINYTKINDGTSARVEFDTEMKDMWRLRPQDRTLKPFRGKIPNWEHGQNNYNRSIVNKWSTDQQDEALEAVNYLQSMEWTIEPYGDFERYIERVGRTDYGRKREIEEMKKIEVEYPEGTINYRMWSHDYRGRMYDRGYMLHIQSDKFRKSLQSPSMKMFKGKHYKTGVKTLKWLYVDLANNLGLDKFGLARRVEIGRGIYNKELSYKKLGGDLDSLEMARLTRDKIDEAKVGNKVNAMVYLDASNQAVQLYAIINRSKQLAKVSNMLDNAELIDAYQMLADYLNEEYGTDRYTRKLCKKALMITLYGSQNGHMEIINTVEEQGKLAEFEADFNAEEPTFQEVVQSAIADLVPEAVETMGDILEINQRLLKPVYTWTLPDGFHVITRIRRKEELVVDIPLDIQDENAEKERYTIVTKKWGASKYSAALAPNIIHSIDGYLARMVILRFKKLGKFITTTHDAYGVHPNDCDLLVQVYKEELWRIAEERVFENILSQIVGEEVTIDNLGDLTFDDIKDSVNMLS